MILTIFNPKFPYQTVGYCEVINQRPKQGTLRSNGFNVSASMSSMGLALPPRYRTRNAMTTAR